jgi:hypothetical protein
MYWAHTSMQVVIGFEYRNELVGRRETDSAHTILNNKYLSVRYYHVLYCTVPAVRSETHIYAAAT